MLSRVVGDTGSPAGSGRGHLPTLLQGGLLATRPACEQQNAASKQQEQPPPPFYGQSRASPRRNQLRGNTRGQTLDHEEIKVLAPAGWSRST